MPGAKKNGMIVIFILIALAWAWPAMTKGQDAGLLGKAKDLFGPLPRVIVSPENPVTPAKAELGKMLFYETRTSMDGTFSCARCHPFSLYGADGLQKSMGRDGKPGVRNAPTVLNAAGQISAHWVGNRKDVEDQAGQSLTAPAAPGMPPSDAPEKKLQAIAGYGPYFEKAFPGEKNPVNVENFRKAVGAFERTLVTPSPFDAFLGGNLAALTDAQKTGLAKFMGTGCVQCHSGTYVGGGMYEKFGVLEPYWTYTKSAPVDEGRFAVTKNADDTYVFKVPGLRNVEMTPPYFHDGSVDRLADAVRIMGKIQLGVALADKDIADIVDFLRSLTGRIPEDALKVPILPRKE
ncbi:MAG: cytochrome-c peroxidase [Candidatus Aminicenantales bacterium]